MDNTNIIIHHTDLDGYGSGIILEKVFPDYRKFICDYNFEDNEDMSDIILNARSVIIADLSVSAEFATKMNDRVQAHKMNALLLDHHNSSDEGLSPLGYKWIHIDQSKSGALLCYEFFKNQEVLKGYQEFAENVSDYDLWKFEKPYSKSLQFLWSSDKSLFTKKFLNSGELVFSEQELALINNSVSTLQNSYNTMVSHMTDPIKDKNGKYFRIITRMERLSSLAASQILTDYKSDTDFLVIYNQYNNSLSFRSQEGTNVCEIAEELGGGGHLNAAGAPFIMLMDIENSVIEHKVIKYNPIKSKLNN